MQDAPHSLPEPESNLPAPYPPPGQYPPAYMHAQPGYAPQPGYPQSPYLYTPASLPQETSGIAITSLVCGIVSWILVPLLCGVVAVVTGHIALSQIRQSEERMKGRGLAIAGLVLGYLNVVLWVVVLIAVVGFFVIVRDKVI